MAKSKYVRNVYVEKANGEKLVFEESYFEIKDGVAIIHQNMSEIAAYTMNYIKSVEMLIEERKKDN